MSWAVVVPTNRPESLAAFMEAWKPLFDRHEAKVIVILDGVAAPGDLFRNTLWNDVSFCATEDLPDFIPRGAAACRSWGIYVAWKHGAKYTLTLDDDVTPLVDVFAEYEAVFEAGAPHSDYLDVGALTSSGLHMRGFPHEDRERREVAVQYGGWEGVLDFDAATQLEFPRPPTDTFARIALPVPWGAAVTGCSMNMAWRTKYAPIMWQLPLFEGRYLRFDDIWSGLIVKRVCDMNRLAVVVNGKASVHHARASDPIKNLEREAPGLPLNEEMWTHLDGGEEGSPLDSFVYATDCLAEFVCRTDADYADHFIVCRDQWLRLFE